MKGQLTEISGERQFAATRVTWALSALCCWSGARAAETPATPEKSALERFLERDYLLGDWGGLRSKLSTNGVDFEFVWFGSLPANVGGGMKQGSVLDGALLMTLDLDSQKLAGYSGGQFHAGSLYIHNGKEFSANYVGDLNKVSLLDFPDTFRLWELWYEQKFLKGKVALKFGQLAIDRDFIVPEFYNSIAGLTFQNQTFFYPTMAFNVWDIPGFPPKHHALASTPYGAPGVRLRIEPTERVYVQAGVYDGNPDTSFSGTRIKLSKEEGALAYFETGYRLNQRKQDTGLPGNYKLGAYFHTGDFLDVYDTVASMFGLTPGTRPAHPNNYGWYFLVDQMVYRELTKDDPAQQGLVAFFRLGGAPKDRNLAQFGVDGGLVYKGLIPSRDWDTLALGASYLEISDDIRRAQRDGNSVTPVVVSDYETVIELSYKAQMTAWWTLQPSVQRVFHPGGSSAIRDAWAVIVMTTLRF